MNATLKKRLHQSLGLYLGFWASVFVRLSRPRIVAVTGSVGKTTTTAVIAAVLSQPEARRLVGSVRKSSGSLNNNTGLPLSVLGFRSFPKSAKQVLHIVVAAPVRALFARLSAVRAETLVLEYAAGPTSSMKRHTTIAPPAVAVVTAVGPAHIERFGTVERIAVEKGTLVSAVPASGLVVLGADNSWAAEMERLAAARVVKVPGRGLELSHNVARAVAESYGLPKEIIERGLANAVLPSARLQTLELGAMTIIDDSYNANPLSMRLGLDTLRDRAHASRRKVAILGVMAELGTAAQQYHQEIGEYAKTRADVVIAVGELARLYDGDHWFPDSKRCAAVIHTLLGETDLVLIKGSHAAHMSRVVRRLTRRFASGQSISTGSDVPAENV